MWVEIVLRFTLILYFFHKDFVKAEFLQKILKECWFPHCGRTLLCKYMYMWFEIIFIKNIFLCRFRGMIVAACSIYVRFTCHELRYGESHLKTHLVCECSLAHNIWTIHQIWSREKFCNCRISQDQSSHPPLWKKCDKHLSKPLYKFCRPGKKLSGLLWGSSDIQKFLEINSHCEKGKINSHL